MTDIRANRAVFDEKVKHTKKRDALQAAFSHDILYPLNIKQSFVTGGERFRIFSFLTRLVGGGGGKSITAKIVSLQKKVNGAAAAARGPYHVPRALLPTLVH